MNKDITSSNYKAILHSKRANIYYLQKCRVMQKDGRVVYLTEEQKENLYWNIPIANTTVILLGMGTSITQAAVRLLCEAGVLIGFCGGGGTPLFSGAEIEWLNPQSEYRPTEYMQNWLSFWFHDEKRLEIAKHFQEERIRYIEKVWQDDRDLKEYGFYIDDYDMEKAIDGFQKGIKAAQNTVELLTKEAQFTKKLYKYAAQHSDIFDFVRVREAGDLANQFLDHGNYLSYGLAATTLWVLGIPHGFAVMHGKTRRGALVFDVADLIKDALILPWSFIAAGDGFKENEFRQLCLQKFIEHDVLGFLFDRVKYYSHYFQEEACRHDGDFHVTK